MERTIFDEIIEGNIKSWKVWENEDFLAFLTPFPSTPGLTVVIPKKNPGDNAFNIDDEVYVGFMKAVKIVANILEKAFDTPRVALIVEGTGVMHAHAKLLPLHGKLAQSIGGDVTHEHDFTEEYRGWLTSLDGPKMDDDQLDEIQAKIRSVQ